MSDPIDVEDLLELIRAQPDNELIPSSTPAQGLVEGLIRPVLAPVFAPLDEFANERPVPAFRLNPDVHGREPEIVSGSLELVSWDWVGIHVAPFRGVPPTGRPVWIRAVTVVFDADNAPRYQHFVDWRRVLIQLGVAPEATRPIVDTSDRERLERWNGNLG